jgi:hypothetical protein
MTILPSEERSLYDAFAPGVAYVAVRDRNGIEGIGTCFHVGDDIFVTARHVVEDVTITKIATTFTGHAKLGGVYAGSFIEGEWKVGGGPYFHPNPNYDLAAVRLKGNGAPPIPFLNVSDEESDALLLKSVVLLGFPPIPGSKGPVLVCAQAEVNATFQTYFDDQRIFIVSSMARGGFSGGPALTRPHHCLGVVTRAVLKADQPEELGFMAVVGPMPVLELLDHHKLMPAYLREQIWDRRKNKTK